MIYLIKLITLNKKSADPHKNDEDGRSNHVENANDSIVDDGDLSERRKKYG